MGLHATALLAARAGVGRRPREVASGMAPGSMSAMGRSARGGSTSVSAMKASHWLAQRLRDFNLADRAGLAELTPRDTGLLAEGTNSHVAVVGPAIAGFLMRPERQ
jgi:hypothetical protein